MYGTSGMKNEAGKKKFFLEYKLKKSWSYPLPLKTFKTEMEFKVEKPNKTFALSYPGKWDTAL